LRSPYVAEGVLNSAERGGYQEGPRPPVCPLQRLSTKQVYVVTRMDVWDAQPVAAIDPGPSAVSGFRLSLGDTQALR
jgi:hypothetical protein